MKIKRDGTIIWTLHMRRLYSKQSPVRRERETLFERLAEYDRKQPLDLMTWGALAGLLLGLAVVAVVYVSS